MKPLLLALTLVALIGIIGGAVMFAVPAPPCIDGLVPGTGILPPGARSISTECKSLTGSSYQLAWFDIDAADLDLLTAALPDGITLANDPAHWAILRLPHPNGVANFACGTAPAVCDGAQSCLHQVCVDQADPQVFRVFDLHICEACTSP